jgi:hypothetical protein
MNRFTILLIIALSMVASLAAVGTATASAETLGVLCTSAPSSHECEAKYAKGTEVTATLTSPLTIKKGPNSITWSQCTGSSIHFIYNGENGLEYKSASFSGCSTPYTDRTSGELVLNWKAGTDNGSTNAFGTSFFEVKGGVYSLTNEGIGTELVGGTSPKLTYNKAPLVGKSGTTESELTLTGEYSLSPTPMYVEKEPTIGNLCETAPVSGHCGAVYLPGTVFTATSVPGTTVSVKGPLGITITSCASSTIKFQYNGGQKLSYAGSTWSSCSRPTSDISAGSLLIRYREGSNEAFYGGTGELMKAESVPLLGTARVGLLGPGIQLIQGTSPKLKFSGATMKGTSSEVPSFSATMTGEYTLSPTPVYVGKT